MYCNVFRAVNRQKTKWEPRFGSGTGLIRVVGVKSGRFEETEGDKTQIADLNRFLHEQAWEAVNAASSYPAARA